MAEQRLNVFPSSMVLAQLKDKLKAAKTGHSLLKRKSDAIKMKLHEVLSKIKAVKIDVGEGMRQAGYAHNDAIWAAGTFNHTVIENVTESTYRLKADISNIAGVKIPKFERSVDQLGGATQVNLMVGLSRGGEQVQQCKEAYAFVLENLVKLATLQTSLQALDDALCITNRRVNALEFLIIPQVENTIRYVISELYEMEREDAYRVKKVKDMRAKTQEAEQAKEQALLDELEKKGVVAGNVLQEDPDEAIDEMFN